MIASGSLRMIAAASAIASVFTQTSCPRKAGISFGSQVSRSGAAALTEQSRLNRIGGCGARMWAYRKNGLP